MMRARTETRREALIEAVRRQIGQGLEPAGASRRPIGCAPIDNCLRGGLAAGALHEVAAADHRALPAAWGFLLALARMTAGNRTLVWPMERTADFGAALRTGAEAFRDRSGAPSSSSAARPAKTRCGRWKRPCASAALARWWARAARMDLTASRRLQLAAEAAATPIFLLRTHKDDAHSAAVTRWRVSPHRAATDGFGFLRCPALAGGAGTGARRTNGGMGGGVGS